MQRFLAPAALNEFGGEPIEQPRVRRQFALQAEVFGRGGDPSAEVVLPHAVHISARNGGLRGAREPAREAKSRRLVARRNRREDGQSAGFDLLTWGQPVATLEQVGLAASGAIRKRQRALAYRPFGEFSLDARIGFRPIGARRAVVGENALEASFSRLRRKIAGSGAAIRTLRGLGYVLEDDVGQS